MGFTKDWKGHDLALEHLSWPARQKGLMAYLSNVYTPPVTFTVSQDHETLGGFDSFLDPVHLGGLLDQQVVDILVYESDVA